MDTNHQLIQHQSEQASSPKIEKRLQQPANQSDPDIKREQMTQDPEFMARFHAARKKTEQTTDIPLSDIHAEISTKLGSKHAAAQNGNTILVSE